MTCASAPAADSPTLAEVDAALAARSLHHVRQRFGFMMLHDRGEFRTDFRPPRLTVAYHAPCQAQGHGIGKRLIAGPADGHLAGPVDDLATRLRMTPGARIAGLPHAVRDRDELTRRIGRRRPAVFLEYDGTLTPSVDRTEDAIISGACARWSGDLRSTAMFAW